MPISGNHDSQPERSAFVTGEWTVEPSRNLLIRGHEQVHLEPRVMDVLCHLAARRGTVVPKDDLVAAVWEDRFVSDDVLTVTIYALRKALGDEARQPRYIETVPRRGYRWVAPIQAAARDRQAMPPIPAARRTLVWPVAAAAAVAIVAVALGTIWMAAPPRAVRHVPAADAHEAYLKGRYYLDQRSASNLQQALQQFERAIAVDPRASEAHAGLADTYSAMSDFGVASPAELRPRAMGAARHALALDADSAAGYGALGRAQFLFDWDFIGAERNLKHAIALDPDYMPAYQAMAWLRSARGQYEDAIAAARRARQLDPVNTARYRELAWVLALGGRHDAALDELDRAAELSPRSGEVVMMKGWVKELTGAQDEAFAAYRDGLRMAGVPDQALQRMQADYDAGGLAGFYRGWLARPRGSGAPMSNTWRAQVCVRAGELDQAIASLQAAFQKRESALAWVRVEPTFAVLRADARFQLIASRVGTPVR